MSPEQNKREAVAARDPGVALVFRLSTECLARIQRGTRGLTRGIGSVLEESHVYLQGWSQVMFQNVGS
jgi:hypothetical protein